MLGCEAVTLIFCAFDLWWNCITFCLSFNLYFFFIVAVMWENTIQGQYQRAICVADVSNPATMFPTALTNQRCWDRTSRGQQASLTVS